jgi:hypothetical protein
MEALRRARWHRAIAVVLPLTILLLAGGSSSVPRFRELAVHARWLGLFALAALAVAQLAAQRVRLVLPFAWAAAAGFVLVALESALWSVDPRLTVGRVVTVCVVFAAAAALALGAARPETAATRVLDGVLAGAAAVALASLVVLVLSHGDAVLPATAGAGWRFRGVGESPNTVPMLLCLALPIAVWSTLARTGPARVTGIACTLLFTGEVAVSGSRGALIAAVGGTLVTALACAHTMRARVVAVAAVIVAALVCVKVAELPKPVPIVAAPGSSTSSGTEAPSATPIFALEDEIGFPPHGAYRPPVARTPFGASGRAEAWNGALEQWAKRPVAGYGFGTEEHVFVDRFFAYESRLVENGYLGLLLQVGAAGLAVFLVLLAALVACGVRLLRSPLRTGPAAAASGVLGAAMLVEMGQTGFLSVGNIAALSIWLAVLPLPLLAREAGRTRA